MITKKNKMTATQQKRKEEKIKEEIRQCKDI